MKIRNARIARQGLHFMQKTISYSIATHPFAGFLLAHDGQGVCALLLGDERENLLDDLQHRFPDYRLLESPALLEEETQAVQRFLDRPALPLKLPLSLHGTAFQQRIWQALQEIPPGTTRSYQDIARQIGRPTASRAVAKACASNPLALVVPCHRVIRSDGGVSGYRWGTGRKLKLLETERTYAEGEGRGA